MRKHVDRSSPTIEIVKIFVYTELLSNFFPWKTSNFCYIFMNCFVVGSHQSPLWPHVQFWEDVFYDSVAQERDKIGMDQEPSEMMER